MSVFDTLAPYYDSWYEGDGRFIFETEVKAIREVIQAVPEERSIEIGIGSGRFAEEFNIKFGIDPSIELLKIARKRHINVFKGAGEFVPFKGSCFNAVFIITTLCFVNSVLKVFQEANRILKNEGDLILGFIPSTGSWGRLYEEKKQSDHPFYKNATFYDFEQLGESLKIAGFSIINVSSTLLQQPDNVDMVELPRDGLIRESGFITIHARKQ